MTVENVKLAEACVVEAKKLISDGYNDYADVQRVMGELESARQWLDLIAIKLREGRLK